MASAAASAGTTKLVASSWLPLSGRLPSDRSAALAHRAQRRLGLPCGRGFTTFKQRMSTACREALPTWRNGVAADVVGRQLAGGHLGQLNHSRLGGAVACREKKRKKEGKKAACEEP